MDMAVLVMDIEEALASQPDASFDLVMADPPYFKVVGQTWDYQWRTFDEYAAWCDRWISEVHRVLKPNGHFWLWGYFDGIAGLHHRIETTGLMYRQVVILDKGMKHVAGRATKNYRQFPNVVEHCANYVRWNRSELATLLKERQEKLGLTAKEINEHLGVKSNGGGMWSIYTGDNICAQIPTEDRWEKLCELLDLDVPFQDIEVFWKPQMGITNVWPDLSVTDRIHPTQKPETAIRRIVQASSRPGARVLDLFAGSLVTARVCEAIGRECLSVERNEEYVNKALVQTGALDPEPTEDSVMDFFLEAP